jgi:nucleotide-binding universal stress UspA family protein
MTEDEAKRIVAAQSKSVFDPARVRVLLASAGGPNEPGTVRLAAGIAKQSAQPVEVISVRPPESWHDRLMRFVTAGPRTKVDPALTRKQLADAGLPETIREIKRRDEAGAIVDEARRGFDVVMMGASRHGSGLGGDTLEQVVREAPCHVVIVKVGTAEPRFARVLVPHDGGLFGRVAVEFAARYADLAGAELTVALMTDRPPPAVRADGKTPPPRPLVEEAKPEEAGLDRIAPVFSSVALKPRVVHVANDPFSSALTAEAGSGKYDLVVIGAENRAVQHQLFFGRDNERIIREAPVTVAIVVPNVALLR